MLKRIGFYGGSFDPIHFGHINLALEIYEKRHLDEIWFCPAYNSPHKLDEPPIEARHRFNMVQAAISKIPFFKAIDIELTQQKPSYTVDTLEDLINRNPEMTIYLIIGDDSLKHFVSWHRIDRIVSMVPLLIGCREVSGNYDFLSQFPNHILEAVQKGLVKTSLFEISSTEIRTRLKKELYCGHLLPKEVLDYIYQFKLYLSPKV